MKFGTYISKRAIIISSITHATLRYSQATDGVTFCKLLYLQLI